MTPLSRNRDERLNFAHIRDIEVGSNRSTYIYIQPSDMTTKTVYGAEAHVDLDENGEIVGVTVLWEPL